MVVAACPPILTLAGRLDGSTVAAARDTIYSAIDELAGGRETQLVIDLSGVESVDATGLGVIAGAHRKLGRQDMRLVLRGCCPQLRRALAMTGLTRILAVER